MVLDSLDLPVVAAPMAGGPSTPELVAAAADAGGLGFLAAGYRTASDLARQIAEVWDATSRPFGVNLFVPEVASSHARRYAAGLGPLEGDARVAAVCDYRESLAAEADRLGVVLPDPRAQDLRDTDDWERKLDLVVRERVPVVSFTFGLPSRAVLAELRRAGVETVQTVTDVDEAREALDAGIDALVVQGPDAGGHRGTLDATTSPSEVDLVDLVAAVRAVTDAPVVAAGGVGTRERADELRAAGASAVQVGTALLLTPEAGTALPYRRALADSSFTTTRVTRAFSGRLGRALETSFVRERDGSAPIAYPEVHHVTSPLRRAGAASDDPSLLALWAGTAWRSTRPVPAATVLRELAPE